MAFDIIEVMTFVLALIVFIFMLVVYIKQRKHKDPELIVNSFLVIYFFVLLNRIFTNIENLFFKELFNLLEHLSILLAALGFAYVAIKSYRRSGR